MSPHKRKRSKANIETVEAGVQESRRRRTAPIIVVMIVPVLLLLPVANRAYNIDDPLFVWCARHLLDAPGDFFGFNANWRGFDEPMYRINQNPPGVSYYLAPVVGLFGEREWALHLALLAPAIAVSLGTYLLAKRWCTRSVCAALAAIMTPCFLITASSVMCDTMMLACYVWAVLLWVWGLDARRWPMLAASGLLIACAALSKYFGITCVPLLAIYAAWRERKAGVWWIALLIPIAILAAYEWYTAVLYGRGMIHEAIAYGAQVYRGGTWYSLLASRLIVGVGFAGGCFATVLCLAPVLWPLRTWIVAAACAVALVAVFLLLGLGCPGWQLPVGAARGLLLAQWAAMTCGGLFVFATAVSDIRRQRDAASLLLVLWVVGTFAFSTIVNWSITGRTLLPLGPPLAILLMRHADRRIGPASGRLEWRVLGPLLPAACIAWAALWGDYAWSNSVRNAVTALQPALQKASGKTYYMGHWGFQYYMDKIGAAPVDIYTGEPHQGDVVVVPENSPMTKPLRKDVTKGIFTLNARGSGWVSVMHPQAGAGFYSHYWGPLPFVFGPAPQDRYSVFMFDWSKIR